MVAGRLHDYTRPLAHSPTTIYYTSPNAKHCGMSAHVEHKDLGRNAGMES